MYCQDYARVTDDNLQTKIRNSDQIISQNGQQNGLRFDHPNLP